MANPTTYYRPKTLVEAIGLVAQPDVIALAGGALTLRGVLLPYTTIIDLQDIPEMKRIEQNTFGAALPLQTLLDWPPLPLALRRALTRTIPLNLRDGITIGESLRAWREPILREWITVLLAHDIGIEYVNPDAECSWDNTIHLLEANRLDQELITAINVPALKEGEALGAAFVARTPADVPIVNAAAFISVDAVHRAEAAFVFVGGASAQPIVQVRLPNLISNPFDEANIASAVKAVAPQLDPLDDYLGSADYRREMARVVVERALLECLELLR